jgi:hypothetical protein
MRAVSRGRWRKREWDVNENEAESWHVDHTALRRPPQAFEKRSRRAARKNTVLATRYGVNRKTVAKWKGRPFSSDLQTRPKNPRSLTLNDEVIILAYRWRTRLSLDDSLVRLRRLMPQLSRSALYRCLEYGLSKIGRTNVSPPLTSVSLAGPFRFEITADVVDLGGLGVPVLLAVEQVTKLAYGEMVEATPNNTVAFLARLVAEFPQKIDAVTTEICPAFVHVREAFGEYMRAVGPHPFAVLVGGWAPKLARIKGASPRSGCDGGGHRLDAEGVEGAAQIVGERRQAELGAHIGEAAHQAP